MASSAIETVVREELRHYPGVELELKNGGKHDRAVFHFGDRSRFMVIPKTPSDWRANANVRRDLKKTLGELGVSRAGAPVGVGARGGKGRRTRDAVAAIALNKSNLVLLIPRNSPLLDRFKGPDGKATGIWQFEIRASADLQAPPLVAIKRVEDVPEGMSKRWGVTRGTEHKTGGWILAIKRTQVPALSDKVDSISSINVKLYADTGNALVFQLPSGTLPTSFHPGHSKLTHDVVPAREPQEEPQATEEAPETPQATEVAKAPSEAPGSLQDRPIVLQFPKQGVSIEQAVALLNKRKQQLGNGLRFTVTEGGYLSVVHRMG